MGSQLKRKSVPAAAPKGSKKLKTAKKSDSPAEVVDDVEEDEFDSFSSAESQGPEDLSDDDSLDSASMSGSDSEESESENDDTAANAKPSSSDDELDIDESSSEAESTEEPDLNSASENKSQKSSDEKSEMKREQKQRQKERKLSKAHGAEIESIKKKIWEKLRSKNTSKAERAKLQEEAFNSAKKFIKELVFRHDSSRVVQTIFKYGSPSQRREITDALKGSYVDLARSSYGKYLLIKMLHYGTAAVRAQILNEMHGHFRSLMRHKEGAYVIEDAFRDYSTAPQRRQILREFYGSEFALFKDAAKDKGNLTEILEAKPDKRPHLLRNLNQVITSAVQKGSIGFEIIHAAMLEYIRNVPVGTEERETFVDLVADEIAEMVHTNAGSQVASLVVAGATAKERKRLVKALKPFADKLAKDQYGNMVLTTLFATVDDTKMITKSLGPALVEDLGDLLVHKYARRPFLYLVAGVSPRYFPALKDRFTEVDAVKVHTSKKPDDARRAELLQFFAPYAIEHFPKLVSDPLGIQFVGELVPSYEDAREPLLAMFEGAITENHPLVKNVASGRILKGLARSVPGFAESLGDLIAANPLDWCSKGTFVVVSVLESLQKPKDLQKALSPLRSTIEEKNPKGTHLLLPLI